MLSLSLSCCSRYCRCRHCRKLLLFPVDTKHFYNIWSNQRLRRWTHVVQMLNKCFVFTGLLLLLLLLVVSLLSFLSQSLLSSTRPPSDRLVTSDKLSAHSGVRTPDVRFISILISLQHSQHTLWNDYIAPLNILTKISLGRVALSLFMRLILSYFLMLLTFILLS